MIDTLGFETSDLNDANDRWTAPRRRIEFERHQAHVVNESIFRSVLVRERKRADRFDQPFLLVLVSLDQDASAGASSIWGSIIEGLAAVKRETDVIGWFDGRSVLGLIVPEVGASSSSVALELEGRVRRELQARLGPDVRSRVSLRLHAHPEEKEASESTFAPVDPLLSSLRPRQEQTPLRATLKRGLDIIGSVSILLVLTPLLLVVAALIKLTSPGPVFFRQTRVGNLAKPFTMLKFRSMHVNNDDAIHQQYVSWFIKSSSQKTGVGQPGVFKIADDPRITPIGHFIRKTSIDELPQFWNVLMGEMSLVGPRPPLPYEVEQYKAWHCRRVLEAQPGITGLWQVTGRSRTTFDEMVRLDLRYARSHSLWTDIKILLATPRAVISGKGAC